MENTILKELILNPDYHQPYAKINLTLELTTKNHKYRSWVNHKDGILGINVHDSLAVITNIEFNIFSKAARDLIDSARIKSYEIHDYVEGGQDAVSIRVVDERNIDETESGGQWFHMVHYIPNEILMSYVRVVLVQNDSEYNHALDTNTPLGRMGAVYHQFINDICSSSISAANIKGVQEMVNDYEARINAALNESIDAIYHSHAEYRESFYRHILLERYIMTHNMFSDSKRAYYMAPFIINGVGLRKIACQCDKKTDLSAPIQVLFVDIDKY